MNYFQAATFPEKGFEAHRDVGSVHRVIHRFFTRSRLRLLLLARVGALVLAAALAAGSGLIPAAAAQETVAAGMQADLQRRAESGDSWAQLNLGAALDHGLGGFARDPVRAVAWYRRAAAAGLAEAQFNLAHCLATGSGTARDDAEALGWMLKAAAQGLSSAQFLAGVMLAEGIGTRADRARARMWLQRAADGGNPDASSVLDRIRALPAVGD